jgi:rRNA maturation RNase YbeY
MPARFHEQEVKSRLRQRRRLSLFLDALVAQYQPGTALVKLTYIFVSDEALLGINQQFLQHDTYTDIITFDQSEKQGELIGEIYVSVDRVAENAHSFKTDYNTELHRVIFHGVLHLCGLLDKTKADAAAMRRAEDAALETYFSTPDPI